MKKIGIFAAIGLLSTSCFGGKTLVKGAPQCNNQKDTYDQYRKCDLTDIKDYYTTLVGDVEKNNKIIVWMAGGPQSSSPVLFLQNKEQIKKRFPAVNKTNKIFESEGIAHVLMTQGQWMKQKSITNKNFYNDFKQSHADLENEENVDIAHNIVSHFKSKGKQVLLGGDSYGGYLTNLYLAKYGDETPDHVVSAVGRLNLKNKEEIRKNPLSLLKENDQFLEKRVYDESTLPKNTPKEKIAEFKSSIHFSKEFIRSISFTDYTKKIKDTDLSKVTFLSAEPDQHVGWFNNEEISWAKSRKAKVKLYTKAETEKYKLEHEKWIGQKFKHNMGSTVRTFAHGVGFWTESQIRKYFVDVFKK